MTDFATAITAGRAGAGAIRATRRDSHSPALGPRSDPTAERRRLETARAWLAAGGSVLIFGRTGTGKSNLLNAAAPGNGRVLRCTPPADGADVAFAGLAGLFSSVTDEELRRLPAVHQRIVASVATGRTDTAAEANPATIRHAVLELLRTLTADGPILLVIDDLHRLDHATAGILRYVAGRVDGLPIWLLAAERVPVDCPPVGRPLCPEPLLVIAV